METRRAVSRHRERWMESLLVPVRDQEAKQKCEPRVRGAVPRADVASALRQARQSQDHGTVGAGGDWQGEGVQ